MTGYTPIPPKLWATAALHRLYDDVMRQPLPSEIAVLKHRIQELEFELEEEHEKCPK